MLIECYVDGASRGQGTKRVGDAAAAAIIYKNKKRISQIARPLGQRTNNEAEYEAVIIALLICSSAALVDPIIYSDSSVVVNQVAGKWQTRDAKLLPLLETIKYIQEDFAFRLIQVPRKVVAEADNLLNVCLDDFIPKLNANSRKS